MSGVLHLAWRYVAFHRGKTAALTLAVTMTIWLPLATHLVVRHYDTAMRARAAVTPLVVGARGNRFDLVLKALYFSDARVSPVTWADYESLLSDELATPIPLELSFTAHGLPIVGTSVEYFSFRGIEPAAGTLPLRLGQAVLGAAAAEKLNLGVGDHLFSDQTAYYDITRTYPLKMQIVGVLAPSDSPDDLAIFTDVKTSWVIAGITHGHQDVVRNADNENLILRKTDDEVVTNPGIFEYNEVTAKNIDSFHTHGSAEELPISAIIVLPRDRKAATILKARYRLPDSETRMLVPAYVVSELMGRVFEVQRVFNAAFALVGVAVTGLLILVLWLSHRLRRREMETMFKLGCSRWMTFWLQAGELGLILVISLTLSVAGAACTVLVAPHLTRLL